MTHANQLQRRDSHLFVGISGEGSQSLQREVERPRGEGREKRAGWRRRARGAGEAGWGGQLGRAAANAVNREQWRKRGRKDSSALGEKEREGWRGRGSGCRRGGNGGCHYCQTKTHRFPLEQVITRGEGNRRGNAPILSQTVTFHHNSTNRNRASHRAPDCDEAWKKEKTESEAICKLKE